MFTMSIVPNDPKLIEFIGAVNAIGSGAGLRNTERAFSALSGAISTAWQKQVGSKNTVQRERITPFNHEVYSEDKMVHWLEYGLPAYDMRHTHTKGIKSRRVKPRIGPGGKLITQWKQKNKDGTYRTVMAGSSYLIIPFRHSTKKSKTQEGQVGLSEAYKDVQNQMKAEGFKRSSVLISAEGSGKVEDNYWGDQVERAVYDWGSKIDFPQEDKYKNLQGMVVMGGPKQSQFMTFRVVSVNSPASSWQHPGIKARHYLENILKAGEETFVTVIEEALKKDLS